MAEQSHKQEMNEAVRGDFERLRARRERSGRTAQVPPRSRPERVVPTLPHDVVDADPPDPQPAEEVAQRSSAESSRSWFRSLLRRG